MNPQEIIEFEKFILWFVELPMIDITVKHELLDRMIKNQGIDQETMVFIDQVMHFLEQDGIRRQKELEQELAQINSDLEDVKSMPAEILAEAQASLDLIVADFKETWNKQESQEDKKEELVHQLSDLEKIQQLKNSL